MFYLTKCIFYTGQRTSLQNIKLHYQIFTVHYRHLVSIYNEPIPNVNRLRVNKYITKSFNIFHANMLSISVRQVRLFKCVTISVCLCVCEREMRERYTVRHTDRELKNSTAVILLRGIVFNKANKHITDPKYHNRPLSPNEATV